jgi:hypothetical protein
MRQSMDSNSDGNINRRYASGLSDELKQLLQPMTGYIHEPLLSLEEACELLINIVSRLLAHTAVFKKKLALIIFITASTRFINFL